MALLFLSIPLPKDEELSNYKISLRILALSYLVVGVRFSVELFNHKHIVDYVSSIQIGVGFSQAILFTLSLITLFNPKYVTQRVVLKMSAPLLIFLALHLITVPIWGYPIIGSVEVWKANIFHPTIVLRELFIIVYALQILYFTRLFFKQEKIYRENIDNYFADNISLRLSWVRIAFLSALFIGIYSILTSIYLSHLLKNIFVLTVAIFYTFIGLRYIQYSKMFNNIKTVIINTSTTNTDISKNIVWEELKAKIIKNKLHCQAGITIDEIAKTLKISRTTLSVFINNEEKMNFNSWINYLRIEESKKLLKSSNQHTLTQIAEMVGYSEQSNFSRQFKIHNQQAPSQWRERAII